MKKTLDNFIRRVIVLDTEPKNTGRLDEEITQLQNYFWPLQYEPCSMHVPVSYTHLTLPTIYSV